MACPQVEPNSQKNHLKLFTRLVDELRRDINNATTKTAQSVDHLFREYAIPSAAVLVAGGALFATIVAANIQAKATLEAANIQAKTTALSSNPSSQPESDPQQKEVLVSYIDQIKALLDNEKTSNSHRELLKARSFAALRILDGIHKGYFIRFLAEGELIKISEQAIALSGADLRKVVLQDAWLPDVNLEGAYLLQGNLSHINLQRANLRNAKLSDTILTGADLRNADLRGADLSNAQLTNARLVDALYNSETVFPSGFEPATVGMQMEK